MYKIVFYITLFSGLFPLLFLFIRKKAFDKEHPAIPLLWLTAIGSLYEFIGSVLLKINTMYWFQLYPFLSFLTLYYFFFKLLKNNYKNLFRVLFILFIAVYLVSFYFFCEESRFITTALNRIPITVFVFTFSGLWFKNLFQKMEEPNLIQSDIFYFITGLIIYYSGTLFLFVASNFIYNSNLYFFDFWIVNIIASFILRILLTTGVWKMKRS